MTYATTIDEKVFDGILHSSGNIYLTGRTGSYATHHFNPFLLKINPEGEMQSVEWIEEDSVGFFSGILELDNNNLVLIGQCGLNPDNEQNKRWLRIIDPELNIISDHFYYQDTFYISVYQDKSIFDYDGNIVSIGTVEFPRETPGFTTTDFFIAKYAQNGDSLDFRIYNFPDHPEDTYEINTIPGSSDYLAITSAFFIGMPSPQFVRINSGLEIISNRWIDVYYQNPLSVDHWVRIFKVPRDSLEIIVQNVDFPVDEMMQSLAFPNPVTSVINIPLKNQFQNIHIELYQADGKKVLDRFKPGCGNLVTLDVNHLPPGIYIYELTSFDKPVTSGKFIKQ